MNTKNVKLTPIQEDYKELIARRDIVSQSALQRLNQIDKEIKALHDEQIKLEDIVELIRKFNTTKS